MKTELLQMAIRFVTDANYDETGFCHEYARRRGYELDNGLWPIEFPILDLTLGLIFSSCDMYNPEDDRSPYEYTRVQFREAVKALLISNGLISGTYDVAKLNPGTIKDIEFCNNEFKTDPDYNPEQLKKLGNFPLDPYNFEKDLF